MVKVLEVFDNKNAFDVGSMFDKIPRCRDKNKHHSIDKEILID